MRKLTVCLVWMAVFAATVGIRHLAAESHTSNRPSIPDEDGSLHDRFEALPRRTPLLGIGEIWLTDAVRQRLVTQDKGIRVCRSMLSATATSSKVFIEISFVPRRNPDGILLLTDVMLERSTETFSPAQERCITEEFARFQLDLPMQPEKQRIPFEFCFGNLEIHSD